MLCYINLSIKVWIFVGKYRFWKESVEEENTCFLEYSYPIPNLDVTTSNEKD